MLGNKTLEDKTFIVVFNSILFVWLLIAHNIYIYAFSRRFYPKRLTVQCIQAIHFVSMCVPWELNPQPFVLLTQCSTAEAQEQHTELVFQGSKQIGIYMKRNVTHVIIFTRIVSLFSREVCVIQERAWVKILQNNLSPDRVHG